MAALVEAIGVISGVLGIIQFGIDNLPKEDSVGSTVRITVGLDVKDGLNNAGGDLPDIRLFNEGGEFLGIVSDPGKVDDGGFKDITVHHNNDAGDQATYALFSANEDAICVAVAAITWPSGDKYGWVGDWGRQCGGSWYYSNVYIGQSNYMPSCLWIDANNDQPQTGFQVHWPEFANKGDSQIPDTPEEQTDRLGYLCNAGPPFKLRNQPDTDPKDITYWVPNSKRRRSADELVGERDLTATAYGAPPKSALSAKYRRSSIRNQHYPRSSNETLSVHDIIATSLVVGNSEIHTAEDLCESQTSYGPDFVNVQTGMFCRMSDKTVWPVCGSAGNDNCFNADTQQLVINGLTARDEPYRKVIDWTKGQ